MIVFGYVLAAAVVVVVVVSTIEVSYFCVCGGSGCSTPS